MSMTAARLDRALVALLAACTLAALLGYAVFALHPELLGSAPAAARAYALAVVGFPRLHMLLGFLALLGGLRRSAATRWIPSLLTLYAVSLGSELLGTSIGQPFGRYRYTPALGLEWFGLVPVLIPLSWCTMTVATFTAVRRVLAVRGRLTAVAAGAGLLIAWDLVLDPAMSRLTPYWVWGVAGPYFGMPLTNLAGWFVTGIALHALLFGLRAEQWVDDFAPATVHTMVVVYAANLLLPFAMTVAAGIPVAALTALGAITVTIVATRFVAIRGHVLARASVSRIVR